MRKRKILEAFVQRPVHPFSSEKDVGDSDTLYIWGSARRPHNLPNGVKVVRVEDGFLRSVGLGAAFAPPLSWVFDASGIYYDPLTPSSLERMLQYTRFDSASLERAARIRRRIISAGLTKYNIGGNEWRRRSKARTILVPGQVEGDASIRFGTRHICTNLALLREVRRNNESAYIVYKPHPDVVHGLRKGGSDLGMAGRYADEVVMSANISSMLDQVDEVHCMTSLAGFEALLRDKPVTCYGMPFYSGWGLTKDVLRNPARTRRLTIDELVAGALIEYPSYLDPRTKRPTHIEAVMDVLLAQRERGRGIKDGVMMGVGRLLRLLER